MHARGCVVGEPVWLLTPTLFVCVRVGSRVCRYAWDGRACLRCPIGGNCSQPDFSFADEIEASSASTALPYIGVAEPRTQLGYWLFTRQKRTRQSACDTIIANQATCKPGEELVDGQCQASTTSITLLYDCTTNNQLYVCAHIPPAVLVH